MKRMGESQYYMCNVCRRKFTVRTGTVFERSHISLDKWLYAMYVLVSVREGISSLQLSKELGITQKSAWFMLHRLRDACGTTKENLSEGAGNQGVLSAQERERTKPLFIEDTGNTSMKFNQKMMDKMTDKVLACKPKSDISDPICEAPLIVGDIELACAVLEGGVRVLSQRQTLHALGRSRQGKKESEGELPSFLRANNLKPFINNELTKETNFIEYRPKERGRTAYGIRAKLLPMICEVFINAHAAGVLLKNQLPTAERCRILQNGLAQVGIIALIDEATGYQDIRTKRALAEILEQYLAEKAMKWSRTFPLEFYRQIYRLHNWEWKELETGKKPPTPYIIGRFTDNLVYRRMAPGLLEELRERNPERRVRHHQWFNPDRGHPQLREHISHVITVMKISDTWETLRKNIDKVFPLQWDKGTLFYEEDDSDLNKDLKIKDE